MSFTTSLKLLVIGMAAATVLLGTSAAVAALISLDATSGAWVAIAPGPDETGNGNINTAGAAFEAANFGWNSSTTYDDSAWAPWSGGWLPADGSVSPFYMRMEFTLGTPTDGSFTSWFDDDGQVWVNGTLVTDDSDGGTGGGPYTTDILSALTTGDNVIAVKGHNTFGGGFGVLAFGGSVDSTPATALPEPSTLALSSILGLLSLGMTGRRRRRR
ncbi:MAG: PEP-CTERM sorting domain-containing protein [Planctomycetota bacterium]|nr:PEP-CTERM sorting domain-containing protein [Planctomycetota bacterium]